MPGPADTAPKSWRTMSRPPPGPPDGSHAAEAALKTHVKRAGGSGQAADQHADEADEDDLQAQQPGEISGREAVPVAVLGEGLQLLDRVETRRAVPGRRPAESGLHGCRRLR